MRVSLVQLEDTNGAVWRLALADDDGPVVPVVLECLYSPKTETKFTTVAIAATVPDSVGVENRGRGVLTLDEPKAIAALVYLMREHGASPRAPTSISEGLSMLGTLPGVAEPAAPELEIPCHQRRNLLEYIAELEGCAMLASSGMWGMWRDGDYGGRGAVVTGAVTDPVCESAAPADLLYILMTQPQAGGQIARKLREACSLLQDLSKAALAARGEIDHLNSPAHRTASYKARIDMFDRWMVTLGMRCAAFPVIQVPDLTAAPCKEPPSTRPQLARHDAVSLAKRMRNEALGLEQDPGDSYSVPSWVVDAIVEASR